MLWLSLGENCLTDDILSRHGKKSFSTPYSPCRSNIEYALLLERSDYEGMLESSNLEMKLTKSKQVVRSTSIFGCGDNYYPSHMRGFEFTHHNPLSSKKDYDSFKRKIQRMKDIRGRQNICFLYFHRKNEKSNISKLINNLREFKKFYKSNDNEVYMAFFYQEIIEDDMDRSLIFNLNEDVMEFRFKTKYIWEGRDPDVFWARNDDDMISCMLDKINEISSR